MQRAQPARLAFALGVLVLVAGLAGCATSNREAFSMGTLPSDLPEDPSLCTQYCRVWVPPVTRKVPYLVQKTPCCTQEVDVPACEIRYRDVCVREPCTKNLCTPGRECEMAAVQVRPGGWKWVEDNGCWTYCYQDPCYQWCNKVVSEDGIEYCMDVPGEYRTVAETVPVTRTRTEYIPGEYCVQYRDEVYRPGRWEWQPKCKCTDCGCPPENCPTVQPINRGCVRSGIRRGVPRTN